MSWKEQLRQATFRGIPFACAAADAELGRRVALHEYPQRDKPFAEDLGRKARKFTLEAFILGAGYMTGRDALIGAIEQSGPGRLVHPYLGEMTVTLIESRGPRESSREGGMARFSLTFVESGEALYPTAVIATAATVATRADLAAEVLRSEFAADFDAPGAPEYLRSDAERLLKKTLAKLDALRRAIPGVPQVVTAYVAALQTLSATVESLIRTPADLAVELYGLIADLALLPDRPRRALAAYRQLWDVLRNEPTVTETTPNRARQVANQAALSALVQRAAIVEACRAAAEIDFDSADEATTLRTELSDQLDLEMATAADDSYQALVALRGALVRDLTDRGADLARLTVHTPTQTVPALVLAQQLYDDPARADEIVARNGVRHPGFVPGGRALEVLTHG
jgi:prophage DNA circulation protein